MKGVLKLFEISEALKQLQENPEDLSELPGLIAKVEEMEQWTETQETSYQEHISKLQTANRNLLAQVPIPGHEPDNGEEPTGPTFADAQKELVNAMENIGGNY